MLMRYPEDEKIKSFVDERGETYCIDFENTPIQEIYYHMPKGDGDRHYCDVVYDNVTVRFFNPKEVVWENINI